MKKLILDKEEEIKLETKLVNYSKLIKITIHPKVDELKYKRALFLVKKRSLECLKYLNNYTLNKNLESRLEKFLVGIDAINHLRYQVRELRVQVAELIDDIE